MFTSSRIVHITLLLVLICVVNGYLFSSNGIQVVADSGRYLEYATGLQSGFYVDPFNIWYIGYSIFILIIHAFGGDLPVIVSVQVIFSCLATVALYFAAEILYGKRASAFIAASLMVLFVDIPQWNTYIHTESIFISFTCFSILVVALLLKKPSGWLTIIAITTIAFTAFIRPTGIALVGAFVAVLCWNLIRHVKSPMKRRATVAGAAILVILFANRMLEGYLVVDNYKLGEVVYGAAIVDTGHYSVDGLIVSPPDHLYVPSESTPPVLKIVTFAFHHPVYWTRLFLTKAFYFFVHVRPFWSTTHNLFSIIFLLPSYFLCFFALYKMQLTPVIRVFVVTFLSVNTFAVCLTTVDWDGRFLAPLLPIIFIFTGRGAEMVWSKLPFVKREPPIIKGVTELLK